MSLNVCSHCTAKFAIGVDHCPQCGNADYYPEGSVPKITRHGGPSYEGEVVVLDLPAAEVVEPGEFGDEDVPEGVAAYDEMLRTDLQEILRARELPTSGNKDELVARLIADDETDVEEPADPGAETEATEDEDSDPA